MQVSVESTSTLERRMKVQVPAEKIDQEVASRLKRVGKTARLDGFRKGKIPFGVIKKRFGPQIHREVLGDIIQSTYQDALREQDLFPAGQPSIEPQATEPGKDLEYTATFEIYPEISITTLDGLKFERLNATIKDADLDTMIETLRRQRATWELAERQAVSGDRITIDFAGSIDGEDFAGGKAEDYAVVIGTGQLLSDLENGLVGMAAGDSRDIEVNFPDSYHAAELAGKTAVFKVTAKAVDEQKLPEVDEEFINAFGLNEGDIDKFKESVKDNMQREMDDRIQAQARQKILDAFWEANKFALPKTLVEQEIRYLQEDSLKRMGITDMSQLPPRDAFEAQASRRVGLGLLINEVIKAQNLKVNEELIDKKLASISANYESPDEVIRQYRANKQMMNQLEMMVLEEQVVELLIDRADVSDTTLSFDEVMSR